MKEHISRRLHRERMGKLAVARQGLADGKHIKELSGGLGLSYRALYTSIHQEMKREGCHTLVAWVAKGMREEVVV